MQHVFLLSPARCDGRRAKMLLSPKAEFALARRVSNEGAPLGEVFAFLSGLYFRGKLAYAHAFGRTIGDVPGALIITTARGLVPTDTIVTRDDVLAFAEVDIAAGDERYTVPLRRGVTKLADLLGADAQVVLLGSIATGKYVDLLLETFGTRLVFPSDFVGRGDMSRGGLLLRCVQEKRELAYEPVTGAARHGKRPPKLKPLR
ncbi:MAG TPA: hypothetical protein VGM82_16485 [Gemmatimonadaceae bacterium]|jgi:hypothetical protein